MSLTSGSDNSGTQLRASIVRRSMVLFLIVAPGYVLNLGLMYGASRLVGEQAFGIFYTSNTAINILVGPAPILGLLLARHFSAVHQMGAFGDVYASLMMTMRRVAFYGGGLAVLAAVLFMLVGHAADVTAPSVVYLIVAAAFVYYLLEILRSYLQSMRQTIRLGLASLLSMVARFAFALTGAALTGLAVGALAGIVAGFSISLVVIWLAIRHEHRADLDGVGSCVEFRIALPFALSFGLVIMLMHIDVIVGYFVLDSIELGIYSATSILPKAVFLVTFPIINVFFSELVNQVDVTDRYRTVVKALLLTGLFCTVGSIALTAASSYHCGGAYGFKSCDSDLLAWLVWATVPLAMLRVLVAAELGRRRDKSPVVLLLPCLAFAVFVATSVSSTDELGRAYFWFSVSSALLYGILVFVRAANRAAKASKEIL